MAPSAVTVDVAEGVSHRTMPAVAAILDESASIHADIRRSSGVLACTRPSAAADARLAAEARASARFSPRRSTTLSDKSAAARAQRSPVVAIAARDTRRSTDALWVIRTSVVTDVLMQTAARTRRLIRRAVRSTGP